MSFTNKVKATGKKQKKKDRRSENDKENLSVFYRGGFVYLDKEKSLKSGLAILSEAARG